MEMLCTCSTERGPQAPPCPWPPSWVPDRLCLPPGGEPARTPPGPVTEIPQGPSPNSPATVKEEEEGPAQVPGTTDQPSTPAAPPASEVLLPACDPEDAEPDASAAAAAAPLGGKCELGAEKDPVAAPPAARAKAEGGKGKAGAPPAAPPQAWLPKAQVEGGEPAAKPPP